MVDVCSASLSLSFSLFFYCPAARRISTLSLHDALPILARGYQTRHYRAIVDRARALMPDIGLVTDVIVGFPGESEDRKSTRLNSSHTVNSYAVFCLKKKNERKSIVSNKVD